MKTIRQAVLGAVVLLFASAVHSLAITNTAITVSSGTNIVLYWPSYGYETYLIQYRQTLSATDSWSQLTNAYYANGTNFTTYTLYGVVPSPASGGSGGGGSGTNPPPPLPDQPMVAPANGTGSAVPLALYPPGFNLTGFNIFDPATGDWVSGNGETVSTTYESSLTASGATPMDGGFSPDDSTNAVSGPQTGFFRVFHIPDWLANFSGYTFDGPTFIPVDFSFPDAPTNEIESSQVLINGQPFDGAVFTPDTIDGTTYWGMGIYFDLLPNGTNTIQLLTTVRESDMLNDQTPYMVFSNAPQTIVIGNSLGYTNWSPLILSNTYTFNAQSSEPNVNWEIDIYDVNDEFVNSQTGTSADGNISWTWDLTDYTGASRLDDGDPFFFAYLTVTNSSGDPGGWMPPLANQFPATGDWIVSYLDNFYDDGTSNYAGADNYYTNGLNTLEGGPLEWSIGEIQVALKFGRVYSQTNRDHSWDILRTFLTSWNNRNFYYFGHGSANTIGGDISTLDSSNNITGSKSLPGSASYLSSQWVHDNVTYNSVWGPMPFRFVFLDGCDTATGNWPWAWGVPKQTVGPDWYRNSANNPSGSRPNAFAGWDVEIGGSTAWGTPKGFWQFRDDWMSQWAGNPYSESLSQAFTDAFMLSNWVAPGQYNHLKYYGFTSMLFLQYNHSGDW